MKRTNSFLLTTTLACCAVFFSAWVSAPIKTTLAPPLLPFTDIYEDAQPGSFLSIDGAPQPWLTNAVKGWMGNLPGITQLNRISIPGTHDSQTAGYAVGIATQSWSIAEQLDAGIRYLDIRLKPVSGTKKFDVYHGATWVGKFDDVLDAVKTFLANQSTEAVLMNIQYEGDLGNDDVIRNRVAECWNDYLASTAYSSIFLKKTGTSLTLADSKGKIVLIRNFGCRKGDILNYGFDADAYPQVQNWYDVWSAEFEGGGKAGESWANFVTKRRLVKEYIDKAISATSGFVYNNLSGATHMTPYDVAVGTNSAVFDKIGASGKKRYLGLIVMDWPGDRMIYRIIKSNFDFETNCNCPAKTFRGVDSYHTWVEFRMPLGKGGEVSTIPAGAYARYVFPACHRTWWTDVKFRCNSTTKTWEKVAGNFGANGECTSYIPTGYPVIVTGDK